MFTVFHRFTLPPCQVELAWQVYARAQDALRQGTHGTHGTVPDNEKHERREWLAQCRQAAEEKAASQAQKLLLQCPHMPTPSRAFSILHSFCASYGSA